MRTTILILYLIALTAQAVGQPGEYKELPTTQQSGKVSLKLVYEKTAAPYSGQVFSCIVKNLTSADLSVSFDLVAYTTCGTEVEQPIDFLLMAGETMRPESITSYQNTGSVTPSDCKGDLISYTTKKGYKSEGYNRIRTLGIRKFAINKSENPVRKADDSYYSGGSLGANPNTRATGSPPNQTSGYNPQKPNNTSPQTSTSHGISTTNAPVLIKPNQQSAYQQYLETSAYLQQMNDLQRAKGQAQVKAFEEAGQQIMNTFLEAQERADQRREAMRAAEREERAAEREREEEAQAQREREEEEQREREAAEAAERARQRAIIRKEGTDEVTRIKNDEQPIAEDFLRKRLLEDAEEKRQKEEEKQKEANEIRDRITAENAAKKCNETAISRRALMNSINSGRYPTTAERGLPDTVFVYFVTWDSVSCNSFDVKMSQPVFVKRMSDKTWPLSINVRSRFEKKCPALNTKMIGFFESREECATDQQMKKNELKGRQANVQSIEIPVGYYKY